jgi:hypothetical protein
VDQDHEFWGIKQSLLEEAVKRSSSIRKTPRSALAGIFQGVNTLRKFFLAFWSVFDPDVSENYVAEDPGKSNKSHKNPISEAPYYEFMEGIY